MTLATEVARKRELRELLLGADGVTRRELLAEVAELLLEGAAPAPADPPRMRPNLEELVAAYFAEEERRGLSPRHIDNVRYALTRFSDWLAPRSLLDVERGDVEQWLDGLAVGPDSRRNYTCYLHAFYVFLEDRGAITTAPTARIRRPKQHRLMPRPIRDADLALALAEAPTTQMRAWLLLAAYAGLRCLEVAGLDREDVDTEAGVLQVRHGKGGKSRTVPIHPDVLAALEGLPMPRSGPLFRMGDGRRVPPYVVSQRIARHLHRHGIPAAAHALRHWYGTRLFIGTHDLRLVQELLGHSSPATTAGYAGWDTRTAAAAVAALSVGGVE